jgi:hypothetical protein
VKDRKRGKRQKDGCEGSEEESSSKGGCEGPEERKTAGRVVVKAHLGREESGLGGGVSERIQLPRHLPLPLRVLASLAIFVSVCVVIACQVGVGVGVVFGLFWLCLGCVCVCGVFVVFASCCVDMRLLCKLI